MINAASIRLVCESGAAADDDDDSKKSPRILKETAAERKKERVTKPQRNEISSLRGVIVHSDSRKKKTSSSREYCIFPNESICVCQWGLLQQHMWNSSIQPRMWQSLQSSSIRLVLGFENWAWFFRFGRLATYHLASLLAANATKFQKCTNLVWELCSIRTVFFEVLKHFKIDPHQTYQKTAWKQLKAASWILIGWAKNWLVVHPAALLDPHWLVQKLACCQSKKIWIIWIIGFESLDHWIIWNRQSV